MTTGRQVLVVAPLPYLADAVVSWLAAAGHDVRLVRDFSDAKLALDLEPPDLLVTELKLGAFNGLHLALRALRHGSRTAVLVVGPPDAGLAADAGRLGARYLAEPVTQLAFQAAVEDALGPKTDARRSPRKAVPRLPATVNGLPAALVDMSYQGLRFEMAEEDAEMLRAEVTVGTPLSGVEFPVRPIWTAAGDDQGMVSCGATLAMVDPESIVAWRDLVDSAPGGTLDAN
ncbi:MAG: hypothetical protein AB7G23_07705 [Vicinamibacterales bacterium]